MGSLMPPHSLTNFKIQTYYENEPRFNPEKNEGWAYIINLDEYADLGTHWIFLFCYFVT